MLEAGTGSVKCDPYRCHLIKLSIFLSGSIITNIR